VQLTGLDWAIIVAYVLFALGIGAWFSRRASESTSEFFLSRRSLPWWVLGTSMSAIPALVVAAASGAFVYHGLSQPVSR